MSCSVITSLRLTVSRAPDGANAVFSATKSA
jgi:hypothetical protein